MLAAATNDHQTLGIFKLVLSLVSSRNQEIPDPLKQRFNLVLVQAKEIARAPDVPHKDVLPESVDLALEMRVIDKLAQELSGVSSLENVTPDIAERMLKEMETGPVY